MQRTMVGTVAMTDAAIIVSYAMRHCPMNEAIPTVTGYLCCRSRQIAAESPTGELFRRNTKPEIVLEGKHLEMVH
jgi:hypothetical protein